MSLRPARRTTEPEDVASRRLLRQAGRKAGRVLWHHGGLSRLYFALKPRHFHAFCVGTAKSGTHSIAGLFDAQYRSAHEVDNQTVIQQILDRQAGRVGDDQIDRSLLERDRRLNLELDSSQLNYFLLDRILTCFPDARFILTIREVYGWLDSLMNHQLARQSNTRWDALRDLRFGSPSAPHPPAESVLAERGLYRLDGYLSYWAEHNRNVLELVPAERLLVVRTHEISTCAPRLAEFLSIPQESLDRSSSHLFRAKQRFDILSQIDRDHLEDRVEAHCRDLMERFFPKITDYAEHLRLRSS